jgi:hypothetical protein
MGIKKEYLGLTLYSKKMDSNYLVSEDINEEFYKSIGLGHIIEEKLIPAKKKKDDSVNEKPE